MILHDIGQWLSCGQTSPVLNPDTVSWLNRKICGWNMRAWEQGSNQIIQWFYSIFHCSKLGASQGESTGECGVSGGSYGLWVQNAGLQSSPGKPTPLGGGWCAPPAMPVSSTATQPDFGAIGEKCIFSEDSKHPQSVLIWWELLTVLLFSHPNPLKITLITSFP